MDCLIWPDGGPLPRRFSFPEEILLLLLLFFPLSGCPTRPPAAPPRELRRIRPEWVADGLRGGIWWKVGEIYSLNER